jgi:hypothetical protein
LLKFLRLFLATNLSVFFLLIQADAGPLADGQAVSEAVSGVGAASGTIGGIAPPEPPLEPANNVDSNSGSNEVLQGHFNIKYQIENKGCPGRSVNNLAVNLLEIFQEKRSLLSLKQDLLERNLITKNFLSSYKINYHPLKKFLHFNFECPRPFFEVSFYKDDKIAVGEGVLASDGKVYDSTFEVLLKEEGTLKGLLPHLALPASFQERGNLKDVINFFAQVPAAFFAKFAEVILNNEEEMTLILTAESGPVSVFLGHEEIPSKLNKLQRIIDYMTLQKKLPSIINMESLKKIVVKFQVSS